MGRKPSMTPSAVKRREDRARKRAENSSLFESPANPDGAIAPDELQIDVTPAEPAPKQSLKDRLFGKVDNHLQTGAKPAKKGQRGKKIDENLLVSIMPSMIAASITAYSQRLIKAPYKPCAPSQVELQSILKPLFSILGRRIEIVGSASEDIIDIIQATLCSFVTGIRMHITYLTIKENEEEDRKQQNGPNSTKPYAEHDNGYTRSYSIPIDRTQFEASSESVVPSGYSGRAATYAADGNAAAADGTGVNANGEADIFADLFGRDFEGRQRLGLLGR